MDVVKARDTIKFSAVFGLIFCARLYIVREPAGVSLAEKVTNFYVYSNLVHMPLSMEMHVWLVIGGGCGQEGHKKDPPKLG